MTFPLPEFSRSAGESQSPEQVKNPPASPAPGPRLRGQKGGGERRKTPKSGKSGPLYAKKGETHNNTGFCSILYFFSRIGTYVLTIAEKNLYISPPKPGTAPKALEKKCNKLVTLQNRSVWTSRPNRGRTVFGLAKGDGSGRAGKIPRSPTQQKGRGGRPKPPAPILCPQA